MDRLEDLRIEEELRENNKKLLEDAKGKTPL